MDITTRLYSEVKVMKTGSTPMGACWMFWNCPDDLKNKCQIYRKKDTAQERCFKVTGFKPQCTHRFDNCYDCAWYKYSREE